MRRTKEELNKIKTGNFVSYNIEGIIVYGKIRFVTFNNISKKFEIWAFWSIDKEEAKTIQKGTGHKYFCFNVITREDFNDIKVLSKKIITDWQKEFENDI